MNGIMQSITQSRIWATSIAWLLRLSVFMRTNIVDMDKMGKPLRGRAGGLPVVLLMEDHRADSLGLLALVLQVVVLDGGRGFLHAHLPAEGVADTDAEVGHRDPADRVAYVIVASRLALELHPAEIEWAHASEGDVQLILEERFGKAQHSGLKTTVPSLQVVALGRCHDVGAHSDIPRKGLLVTEHDVALPAMVTQIKLFAAHVDVSDTSVQGEAGLACGVPIDEGVEAGLLVAGDVAVGAVQHVALVEAVLLDAVVADALTECQVDYPLRVEEVVDKADVVYLLGVEVGVTVADRGWVRAVDVGIEQRDARPADAQVVGSPDVLRVVDLVGEVGRRDEVAVVQLEVVGLPQPGDDVLPRVLIAQAGGERQALDVSPVFGIARQDAVLMAVVEAARPRVVLRPSGRNSPSARCCRAGYTWRPGRACARRRSAC